MKPFLPKRVFFEPKALDYSLGRRLYDFFRQKDIEARMTASHNRVTGIPGKTVREGYREAKETLVIGVRKSGSFATCKPSAHYQLPLATSCPGMCEYCYLATTLGKKPYLRVYVNIEEILDQAQAYINERAPEITVFEGSATSDPVPTEYLTGALKRTIEFFGRQELGRFRFVTKYSQVESLLNADHNGHTRFRFSLNAAAIIDRYEHRTASMAERVEAAAKVARAGYPLGFIVAPIFVYPGWEQDYQAMFSALDAQLPLDARKDVTFEFISHRFTTRAKANILEIFPQTTLPLNEQDRKFKFGQFGYGKYVYTAEVMQAVKTFMQRQVAAYFPEAKTEYFV
ncbi:spore photoproduct lyase [Sporolituus thermophilus]|uniref:Spore photoproduct lyase n=1 Tax=Sporolituus thermophilus DSM 23256 TaxID=1123285 RepID=A0A1G7MF99_9FIRM|nr:spore photoproduct lyase [Sporolituus thermophilus]SDF60365.1 spore photoproduct lyase [Sporolituus thermophilus DSM 23256]